MNYFCIWTFEFQFTLSLSNSRCAYIFFTNFCFNILAPIALFFIFGWSTCLFSTALKRNVNHMKRHFFVSLNKFMYWIFHHIIIQKPACNLRIYLSFSVRNYLYFCLN
ncbi:hypothetical protein T11_8560, partial [Trichinella zimbabwensis]